MEAKKRSSNLELFRIVAMLGIILSHYEAYLFDLIEQEPTSAMSLYHYTLCTFGKVGINCFMFITGYFMCTKDISMKKYIKLLSQIYFYKIVIQGIFVLCGDVQLDLKCITGIIFSFKTISMDSFVTDFLWFYLFIPFVSILIRNLTQAQHKRLLLLSIIMFVGYSSIPGFHTEICTVTWFSVLMLVASYIRFYGVPFIEGRPVKYYVWGFISILFLSVIVLCIYVLTKYQIISPRKIAGNSAFLLVFVFSTSLFLTFLKLKIPYNKYVNLWGGAAFGVLLIHTNGDAMWELIFLKIVDTRQYFIEGCWWMPIITAIGIYVVCGTLEIIRQKTVEKPILNALYKLFRLD